MKKIIVLTIASMALFNYVYGATLTNIQKFDPNEFSYATSSFNGVAYHILSMKSCALNTEEVGKPKLPEKTVRFLVPSNSTVTGVNVINSTLQSIIGNFNVYPTQSIIPTNGEIEPIFIEPDPIVYGSAVPYPGRLAVIKDVGAISEYKVVDVRFSPLQYMPALKQLALYTSITIELEYTENSCQTELPCRRSEFSQNSLDCYVLSMVENKNDFIPFTKTNKPIIQKINKTDALNITPAPSINGQPIDYVIITTNDLVRQFEKLAEWKNKKGIITVIKTVDWIEQNYDGIDTQEKIRNFIKSCWKYWGTMYYLVGGNPEKVPIRNLYCSVLYLGAEQVIDKCLPTDVYYSDISDGRFDQSYWEYNYNFNKDNFIGHFVEPYEGSEYNWDKMEGIADVFLGRIAVKDTVEADIIIGNYKRFGPKSVRCLIKSGNKSWFFL